MDWIHLRRNSIQAASPHIAINWSGFHLSGRMISIFPDRRLRRSGIIKQVSDRTKKQVGDSSWDQQQYRLFHGLFSAWFHAWNQEFWLRNQDTWEYEKNSVNKILLWELRAISLWIRLVVLVLHGTLLTRVNYRGNSHLQIIYFFCKLIQYWIFS